MNTTRTTISVLGGLAALLLITLGRPEAPVQAQIFPACRATLPGAQQFVNCLEIIKVTVPGGSSQSFDFEIDGDFSASFDLQDGDNQVIGLIPGMEFTITEIVPDGWDLFDLECEESGFGLTLNVDEDEGEVEVIVDEQIDGPIGVCTFFNREGEEDDEDEDKESRPNLGGVFGNVDTAQRNRARAGVIAPTPRPAVVESIRPPSTGDGGLLP